jgi:hypothetical protein
MRNYTLRIVPGSSLFSLLIMALWMLPICMSCNLKNPDQPGASPSPEKPVVDEKEIEETWVCIVCESKNDPHQTICCHCGEVRQPADYEQSQDVKEENLEYELGQMDPNKVQCPVCLNWFPVEQQATCKHWTCDHFVCKTCFRLIERTKKLQPYCPLCRCQALRSEQGEQVQVSSPATE